MATKKSQSEFQEPNSDDGQKEASGDLSGYEAPGSDDAMAAEAAESEAEAFLTGVDGQILSVKAELEKLLASISGEAAGAQSQAAMDANIVGVGIGLGDGLAQPAQGFVDIGRDILAKEIKHAELGLGIGIALLRLLQRQLHQRRQILDLLSCSAGRIFRRRGRLGDQR